MKKTSKQIYFSFIFIMASIIILTLIISLNQNTIIKTEEKLEQYTAVIGTQNDLNEFRYVKDDSQKTVTLKQYYGNTTTEYLNIYEKYDIGGVKYTTIIEKDDQGGFFEDNIITKIDFCGNVKWKGNLRHFFHNCKKLQSINFGNIQYEGILEEMR